MHAFGSRGATNNAYSLYSTTASTAHDRKRGSGGDSVLPGMKQATAFTSNFHPFSQRHARAEPADAARMPAHREKASPPLEIADAMLMKKNGNVTGFCGNARPTLLSPDERQMAQLRADELLEKTRRRPCNGDLLRPAGSSAIGGKVLGGSALNNGTLGLFAAAAEADTYTTEASASQAQAGLPRSPVGPYRRLNQPINPQRENSDLFSIPQLPPASLNAAQLARLRRANPVEHQLYHTPVGPPQSTSRAAHVHPDLDHHFQLPSDLKAGSPPGYRRLAKAARKLQVNSGWALNNPGAPDLTESEAPPPGEERCPLRLRKYRGGADNDKAWGCMFSLYQTSFTNASRAPPLPGPRFSTAYTKCYLKNPTNDDPTGQSATPSLPFLGRTDPADVQTTIVPRAPQLVC